MREKSTDLLFSVMGKKRMYSSSDVKMHAQDRKIKKEIRIICNPTTPTLLFLYIHIYT